MDLDHLLVRFFGTSEIAGLTPEQLAAGAERLQLQFGLEKDGGRRFALWSLMYMLGMAPEIEIAFYKDADRDAAREFMNMADREMRLANT